MNIICFILGSIFGMVLLIVISCVYAGAKAEREAEEAALKEAQDMFNHPDRCDGNIKK